MIRKFKDPFGGVHGEVAGNSPSPFKIDKEEALKEIKDSLDKWDQKKVWELSSRFLEVDLLPGPENVFQKIIEEFESNELIFHTLITLKRVFISFMIAMFIGSFFGIFMGRKEKLNVFLDDWLVLGLNVPALVIIILSYVWFGLNEVAAILAVSLNKIPMVAVIMREGARSLESDYK